MAAFNLHYPKMKVFELSSTQVASGAKIYTYEAGTSTDKATYSDQALTTANANPIIADSNGEAQVWLKDDGLYKIVINDSDDVLISSTDNLGTESATTTVDGAYSLIPNGSFEANTGNNGTPDSWDLSITGASTIDIDTGDQIQGTSSLQFVGGASGAGTATTTGFFEVQASKEIAIRFALKASLATVGNTVKFLWYTSAQAAASVASTTVYNVTTSAPTTWVEQILTATPGSDVKYGRVQISGSTTAGTTHYDDVVVFNKESLLPVVGSNIASAAELPVNVTGDYHDVTGTTTVTSFAAKRVGTIKKLQFDGILILTHHATDLILPGGTNIITAAGDVGVFIEYSSGDWKCLSYQSSEIGSWTLISQAVISSDATVDFTGIDSTHDYYKFILTDIISTGDNENLLMKVAHDAAPTWEASLYDYHITTLKDNAATYAGVAGAAATEGFLYGALGITAKEAISGTIEFSVPGDATNPTIFLSSLAGYSATPLLTYCAGVNSRDAASVVQGVRFYTTSGLSTGTITLYGLKK